MIDLRTYRNLIEDLLADANSKDDNWKFKIRHISKGKCTVKWSYLDYVGEKDNYFSMEMDYDDDGSDIAWIFLYSPCRDIIECYMVTEEGINGRLIGALTDVNDGLRFAIDEMNYYAHSRY